MDPKQLPGANLIVTQQGQMMDPFESFAAHTTDLIVPWLTILISVMAALWLKEFAANFLAGLAFRYTSPFQEGDHVIIDGDDAMIIKVGIGQTVFGRYSDNGYTWRYIPNDQIHSVKIEKLIRQDLHLDTDIEKGRRLMELIMKANHAYNQSDVERQVQQEIKHELKHLHNGSSKKPKPRKNQLAKNPDGSEDLGGNIG